MEILFCTEIFILSDYKPKYYAWEFSKSFIYSVKMALIIKISTPTSIFLLLLGDITHMLPSTL